MFVLEPIAQLGAMMLCLRMAKAHEGPLGPEIASLEARTKSTKSSDRAGWLEIYRGYSSLIPKIVEAHSSANPPAPLKTAAMPAHRVTGALTTAQGALQRAAMDWGARLSQQERDLAKKAADAAERLPIVSNLDDAMGELVYAYDPAQLDAFWSWVSDAERLWTTNNAELVALRAQEALSDALADLQSDLAFRVSVPSLALPSSSRPRLKGHRIQNPGFFQSLGSTYRFVMSGVTAVSGLGFFATRVLGGAVAQALPIVLGAVFVGTVVVAAVTIPKQRRQTLARLKARAAEVLERELSEALRDRFKAMSEAQLASMKKHLTAEAGRLKGLLREQAPPAAELASPSAFNAGFNAGLSPNDLSKLRGEWKDAIAARIQQLEGELARGGAAGPARQPDGTPSS